MYISAIKRNAKKSLRGRILKAAGATLIIILLTGFIPNLIQAILKNCISITANCIISSIISIIISSALSVGIIRYFISFSDKEESTELPLLFSGLDAFFKVFAFELLVGIIISIFCFAIAATGTAITRLTDPNPFVVAALILIYLALYIGIIYFILRLFFVIFIFAENEDIKLTAAIKRSLFLTSGYTGKLFLTGLSFILWILFCILIIPIFYVFPYMQLTFLNFYYEVKKTKHTTN